MTIPFLLCLLVPVVYLVKSRSGGEPPTQRASSPTPQDLAALTLVGCCAAVAALTTLALLVHETPFLLDDSYITYRYAKHLGQGHGLAWNPGDRPDEGFTNLLLVLLMVPVVTLGGDPLLATRIASALAALCIAAVLYRTARRDAGASGPAALLIALATFTASFTSELIMLGLETVLFTAALLGAFEAAQCYFQTERARWMRACGGMTFLAFTLRPEAIFLPLALIAVQLGCDRLDRRRIGLVLKELGIGFVVPLALLLCWKQSYFGSIIPSPALVKMPGHGITRARGVASVGRFVNSHAKLVLFAAIGSVLPANLSLKKLATSGLMIVAYLLFYLRVDTLMDLHQRFLYPAFPFLLILGIPALVPFIERFLAWKQPLLLRVALGVALFTLAFYDNPGAVLRLVAQRGHGDPAADREALGASPLLTRIGQALATHAEIGRVTIASTDAGLVPYFSGARHVDMAGLVTRFIATHRDVQPSADYLFAQQPDVIFVRTPVGGALMTDEHGILGNYALWAHHPGWDAYRELGGAHAGIKFDLHFYLRRGGRHEHTLSPLFRQLTQPDVVPVMTALGTRAP